MTEIKRRGVARAVNIHEGSISARAVYCGRPGKGLKGPLGNPHVLTDKSKRGATLANFKAWMDQALDCPVSSMPFYPLVADFVKAFREVDARLDSGEDIDAACFCVPNSCHAVILCARWNRGRS